MSAFACEYVVAKRCRSNLFSLYLLGKECFYGICKFSKAVQTIK